MSGLVRIRTVLEYDTADDDIVSFGSSDGTVGLAITGDDWLRMDTPDEVTVTIEVGDTLN